MAGIEDIVREALGERPGVKYAILSSFGALLASNMRRDEVEDARKALEHVLPLLKVGFSIFRRKKDGGSTLFYRVRRDLVLVLSGLWVSPGDLISYARSVSEKLEEKLREPVEPEVSPELVSARPVVCWGREVSIRLSRSLLKVLRQMDGRSSVREIAERTGLDLAEVLELVAELRRAGAIELGVGA